MALDVDVGAFNVATALNGTVTVTTGFQPKAIIFWWSGRTETVDTAGGAHHKRGIGFATSTTDRRCVFTQSRDAVASANAHQSHRDDACIGALTTAGGADGRADIDAILSTGFRIITDQAFGSALRVHYLALGGADLTNATTGTFNTPEATGNFDVTTVGFQPDAVLFAAINTQTDPPTTVSDSKISFGGAAGAGDPVDGVVAVGARDAVMTMQTWRHGKAGHSVAVSEIDAINTEGHVSAWLSNGFRINFTRQLAPAGDRFHFLALKGGKYAVGDLLTRTNTTNFTETGVGFQPKAALFASHCAAAQAEGAVIATDEWSVGAATGPAERGAQCLIDEDATADGEVGTAVEHDEVYANLSTADAIEGLMDLVSFDADGMTLVMDDADPAQNFVWYMAFGDSPAAVFNETVQVGPIVISPAVQALLSGVDKPSPSFVISPTSKDVASLVDRPLRTFAVVPAASEGLSLTDKPSATLVILPFAAEAVAKNEFVAVPFTILPSEADRLSAMDKPVAVLAVSPASRDVASLAERPQASIIVVPSAVSAKTSEERVQAAIALALSALDRASSVDRPSASLSLSMSAKDIASLIDKPTSAIILSSASMDARSMVERPGATVFVAVGAGDQQAMVERPSPTVTIVPSARDVGSFIDKSQIGPIIIMPTVFDTLGAPVFNEIVQATITILSTVRDRAELVDRPAATVVVAPGAKDALSIIESLSSPFAVVPSVKDIAAFVDRPVGAIVVVPSVSDIFTPGGELAETVLATIKILISVQDELIRGPVFSAGGRRHEVSGRVLVVSRADGRMFEVSPRGTLKEVKNG